MASTSSFSSCPCGICDSYRSLPLAPSTEYQQATLMPKQQQQRYYYAQEQARIHERLAHLQQQRPPRTRRRNSVTRYSLQDAAQVVQQEEATPASCLRSSPTKNGGNEDHLGMTQAPPPTPTPKIPFGRAA